MTGFFSELGKQLAEKWVSLLVMPGLLFAATVVTGLLAGHRHAWDVERLVRRGDQLATSMQKTGTTAVLLAAAAVLLAAAACGVLARAVASLVEQAWLGRWPAPLRRFSTSRTQARAARWTYLSEQYEAAEHAPPAVRDRLAADRRQVSGSEPQRPTWMGDRLCSVDAVIWAEYRLDLTSAWPRLWLLAAPESRTEIQSARVAFDRATLLAGWGVLYLLVGIGWWPAIILGSIVWWTAWRQGRSRIDAYADLAEALVDLHIGQLAAALSIPSSDPSNTITGVGRQITERLRKGR
ncbi:hypothetical protein [Micromonospora sp. M61]|uniref:hypothetical protein n=1 Tax=Micromonospora sp. M61 TaxID=2824890 RepID=UPI001B366FEA|nr:hypothetical protein [Micromonospora sp. M61]MBQ0977867.1 hypothetical protein [Micromonospora sp. M61]